MKLTAWPQTTAQAILRTESRIHELSGRLRGVQFEQSQASLAADRDHELRILAKLREVRDAQ